MNTQTKLSNLHSIFCEIDESIINYIKDCMQELLPPNHDNASTYLYITQKVLAKSIVNIADIENADKLIVAKKFYDELTRLLKCALVIKQDESICEISNDSSITIEEYLGIIEKIDVMVLDKIRNEMIDKLPKKSRNTGAYLYLIARVGVKVIGATFMRIKTKQDLMSYAKKIIHDINDLIKCSSSDLI